METIGALGLGDVGKTLASIWKALGLQIVISAMNLPAAKEVGEEMDIISLPPEEMIERCEMILIAVPWKAIQGIIVDLGPETFKGKILIDAVNPILEDLTSLEIGHSSSGGEKLQSLGEKHLW